MVGLVQLVRAPVCGTGSHGFESHIPPHLFLNPVTGVSPRGKARVFDSRIRRFKSCHPSQFKAIKQETSERTRKFFVYGNSKLTLSNSLTLSVGRYNDTAAVLESI